MGGLMLHILQWVNPNHVCIKLRNVSRNKKKISEMSFEIKSLKYIYTSDQNFCYLKREGPCEQCTLP